MAAPSGRLVGSGFPLDLVFDVRHLPFIVGIYLLEDFLDILSHLVLGVLQLVFYITAERCHLLHRQRFSGYVVGRVILLLLIHLLDNLSKLYYFGRLRAVLLPKWLDLLYLDVIESFI